MEAAHVLLKDTDWDSCTDNALRTKFLDFSMLSLLFPGHFHREKREVIVIHDLFTLWHRWAQWSVAIPAKSKIQSMRNRPWLFYTNYTIYKKIYGKKCLYPPTSLTVSKMPEMRQTPLFSLSGYREFPNFLGYSDCWKLWRIIRYISHYPTFSSQQTWLKNTPGKTVSFGFTRLNELLTSITVVIWHEEKIKTFVVFDVPRVKVWCCSFPFFKFWQWIER